MKNYKFTFNTGIWTLNLMGTMFLGGVYANNLNRNHHLLSPLVSVSVAHASDGSEGTQTRPTEVQPTLSIQQSTKDDNVLPISREEVEDYIKQVFKEDYQDASTILDCENHDRKVDAINYNRNGSTDHGLLQINSIHSKRFGESFKTDWKRNVDVAHQIFLDRGWSAWTCSYKLGIKPFYEIR